jgi:hypothetical protein
MGIVSSFVQPENNGSGQPLQAAFPSGDRVSAAERAMCGALLRS